MCYLKLCSLITEHGIQEFVVNLLMSIKQMKNNYGGKCIGQKKPYDPNRKKHEIKYAFKIGDRVRTTFLRRPFQCEYDKVDWRNF